MTHPTQDNPQLKRHLRIMVFVIIGMFGFCFAMVPLYNVLCKVTGLNGKTPGEAVPATLGKVDMNRTVTVTLVSTLNEGMSAEFDSKAHRFSLHPGEVVSTGYWVKNLTDKPMVVQAIPSVAPGYAGQHIKKVECFCFERQPLAANEGKWMPLSFTVAQEVPHKVKELTLSYTLFDITDR